MPTYKNEASKVITLAGVRMEGGGNLTETMVFIPNLPGKIGTHADGRTAEIYDDGLTFYYNALGTQTSSYIYASSAAAQSALGTAGYVISNGISKTLDTPFYNPVLLSQVVLVNGTVSIPASITDNYKISIYATGELTVKFNSADATAYLVPQGSVLEKLCSRRIINDIRLTIEEDRAAYIHIERAQ